MPRFFFHIIDGQDVPDDTGTELPGPAEARREALITAGQLLQDAGDRFWSGRHWRMHVTDEHKEELFVLRFSIDPAERAA